MSKPTYLQQPTIVRLPSLLAEVARGEIRIARFQRRFVWSDEQRLLLFDSIYKGIPIGSILVWRTREHDLKTFARIGELSTSTDATVEMTAYKQFVLDGFQRLTTLYSSLGKGLSATQSDDAGAPGSEPEGEWQEFGRDLRPIYFDLEEREFELEPSRPEIPRTWIRLSVLLDTYDLYAFQKGLSDLPDGRVLVNRAETLANTFKDYMIPVMSIASEDLDMVTECFYRVNTAGQSMDLVSMVNALLWSPDFDVIDRVAGIRSELADVGWGDIEETMILDVCKTTLDLELHGTDVREIKEALLSNRRILDDAAGPLRIMANFLARRCKILSPRILPYRYQAVLLADAMRIAGQNLSEEIENSLERWLWMTTYGEYFAGISPSRLRKAVEHLRRVVQYGEAPEPPDLTKETRPWLWPRFDFRIPRLRALLLRMAELDPRGPEGECQYPFRLLAENGKDATPMLILSREIGDRTAVDRPENRIIADPKNIGPIRRLLRSGTAEAGILRSHGIDDAAAEALRKGDFRRFLEARRRFLANLERRFVEELGLTYLS